MSLFDPQPFAQIRGQLNLSTDQPEGTTMTTEERATIARVYVELMGVPACEGTTKATFLLDSLLGLPGTQERRAAFKAAHAAMSPA